MHIGEAFVSIGLTAIVPLDAGPDLGHSCIFQQQQQQSSSSGVATSGRRQQRQQQQQQQCSCRRLGLCALQQGLGVHAEGMLPGTVVCVRRRLSPSHYQHDATAASQALLERPCAALAYSSPIQEPASHSQRKAPMPRDSRLPRTQHRQRTTCGYRGRPPISIWIGWPGAWAESGDHLVEVPPPGVRVLHPVQRQQVVQELHHRHLHGGRSCTAIKSSYTLKSICECN